MFGLRTFAQRESLRASKLKSAFRAVKLWNSVREHFNLDLCSRMPYHIVVHSLTNPGRQQPTSLTLCHVPFSLSLLACAFVFFAFESFISFGITLWLSRPCRCVVARPDTIRTTLQSRVVVINLEALAAAEKKYLRVQRSVALHLLLSMHLFSNWPVTRVMSLSQAVLSRYLRQGDILLGQGDPQDFLCFVLSGTLKLQTTVTLRQSQRVPIRPNVFQCAEVQSTRTTIVDRIGPGDVCMEEALMLPHAPCIGFLSACSFYAFWFSLFSLA